MTAFLKEREVGFDSSRLGYPSVANCLAVCYVTPNGLFGLHNNGAVDPGPRAERSTAFANFVMAHASYAKGTRLYGVTFAANNRYPASPNAKWAEELGVFATALGFDGKIRGFDLANAGITGSAYVEFRWAGEKAEIWVEAWTGQATTTGAPLNPHDQKFIANRSLAGTPVVLLETKALVVRSVAVGTLTRAHSVRLRH
ncbi:hypothetical protein [Falsiroseomonas oryzae]|uniref:hypothetical protein n=1 Tax=Falsiroseomonas oryzae TaxID=2766473 RepID=UPI0022EA4675|nr:hypothetical protein [Roseomonas sp. MO-31]